jgi:hypothetical protein
MAQFLELDHERLLAFANGQTINNHTIATSANPLVIDSAPALETVTSAGNGWSLVAKVMSGAKEIYTITHT